MPYEVTQVRNLGQLPTTRNRSPETNNSRQPNRTIQEATGLGFTPDGKVAMVVDKGEIASTTDLICNY